MKNIKRILLLFAVFLMIGLDSYSQVDRPPAGLTFIPSSDTGDPARTIKAISLRTQGDSVLATLYGDGVLTYGIYLVPSPPRLVVDLLGVQSRLKTQLLPKPHPYFERARTYQYPQVPGTKQTDQAFTRIIFDVKVPVSYRVTPDSEKITIELLPTEGQVDAAASATTESAPPPTAESVNPAPVESAPAPPVSESPSTNPPVEPVAKPALNPIYLQSIEPADVKPDLFFTQSSTDSTEYRLGPEDVLQVSVFQLPELNVTSRVSGTGTVTLPLIGTITVQGKTAGQVGDDIAKLLGEKYLQNPQVTVFISEFNSQKVSVIGKFQNPGSYTLLGNRTIIQLIAQAGGVAEGAGKTLFVFRQAPDGRSARLSIPLEQLLVQGDPNWNIWVKAGDVVSIPALVQISVSVLGAVATPGTITFVGGEGATLLNAVARAGGLKGASKSGIKIKRKDASGVERILEADLGDIISGKKPDMSLENGDVIVIKESFF